MPHLGFVCLCSVSLPCYNWVFKDALHLVFNGPLIFYPLFASNDPAPISRSLSAGALNGGAVKYYWMHLNHCTAWNISPWHRENPSCSPAGADICYNSLRAPRQDDRFVIERVWMSFLCGKKLLPPPSSERKNSLHIDRKSHREFWIYKMQIKNTFNAFNACE